MDPVHAGDARTLLEAAIAAFSVLGGGMAYWTGLAAARALIGGHSPDLTAQEINTATGEGFVWSAPAAIIALIIMLWS